VKIAIDYDPDGLLDFDGLARTLEVIAGENVQLAIASATDDESAPFLGVVHGVLSVRVPDESDIPPGEVTVDLSRPMRLVEIGNATFVVAADQLAGAAYREGRLTLQVGALLMALQQDPRGETGQR